MIDLAQDLVEVSAKNNPELLNEQDTVTRDPVNFNYFPKNILL